MPSSDSPKCFVLIRTASSELNAINLLSFSDGCLDMEITRRKVAGLLIGSGVISSGCLTNIGAEEFQQQKPRTGGDDWQMYQKDSRNSGRQNSQEALGTSTDIYWSKELNQNPYGTAIYNERLYVTTIAFGSLYCIDIPTGSIEWEYSEGEINSFPVNPSVSTESVYVISKKSTLFAISTESGQRQWSIQIGNYFDTSPVYKNGQVYIGGDKFYSIDAEEGVINWQRELESRITATPAISENFAYVITEQGYVHAINLRTRSVEWHREIGRDTVHHGPVQVAGKLYISNGEGKVHALSAEDGTEEWVFDARWRLSAPIVASTNTIFISTEKRQAPRFYAIDSETGSLSWESLDVGFQSGGMSVAGDFVIAMGGSGIVVLDIETGEVSQNINLDCDLVSTPIIAGNVLFVGCENHNIHALTPSNK